MGNFSENSREEAFQLELKQKLTTYSVRSCHVTAGSNAWNLRDPQNILFLTQISNSELKFWAYRIFFRSFFHSDELGKFLKKAKILLSLNDGELFSKVEISWNFLIKLVFDHRSRDQKSNCERIKY
jgi:hypothetical protein